MIAPSNPPTDLSDYHLAVIASHNVFTFLQTLVCSLTDNQIRYRKLVIGDAGLLPSEIEWVRSMIGDKLDVERFDLREEGDGFVTQSAQYRKIIYNRVPFLRDLFLNDEVDHVVQLDADTMIVSNDFSLLDRSADVTLNVHKVAPNGSVFKEFGDDYPNCGVIFWHNPWACFDVLATWERLRDTLDPHPGQFEQNCFLHMMASPAWKHLDVQMLHCRFYNCYHPFWFRDSQTSLLHLKGSGVHKTLDARLKRMLNIWQTGQAPLPDSGWLVVEDASCRHQFELQELWGEAHASLLNGTISTSSKTVADQTPEGFKLVDGDSQIAFNKHDNTAIVTNAWICNETENNGSLMITSNQRRVL